MKLSQLIAAIGDDVVKFQNLDVSANSLKWNEKRGTTIQFCTEVRLDSAGTEMLGLVVWLPRDAVDRVMAEAKVGGCR